MPVGSLNIHGNYDNNNVKNQLVLLTKQQLCTCITLFDVHCTTATWNLQIQRSMGTWAYFFLNLDKDLKSSTPGKSAKWKTTQIVVVAKAPLVIFASKRIVCGFLRFWFPGIDTKTLLQFTLFGNFQFFLNLLRQPNLLYVVPSGTRELKRRRRQWKHH